MQLLNSGKVLTDDQLDEMKRVFDLWSTEETVDTNDLQQILKSMGIQLEKREHNQMISRMNDLKGDGHNTLDFRTFKSILPYKMPKTNRKRS